MSMFERPQETFEEIVVELGDYDLDRGWVPVRHAARGSRVVDGLLLGSMVTLTGLWLLGIFVGIREVVTTWPIW
jgi:hypothetical protein